MSEGNVNQNAEPPVVPNVPPVGDPTPAPAPTINFETLIANARNEEKKKLYPQIETLKVEVEKLTKRNNELLLTVGEKEEALGASLAENATLKAENETLKAEGEKNVGTNATIEQLQDQIEKLKLQVADKDTEIANVKSGYELKEYRSTKLADVDESVHDLVTGKTQEEIDASVAKAKETFEKIASKFSKAPAPAPSVASKVPPVNMNNTNDQFKNVTAEDIENMDFKTYAEYRKSIGMR